MNLVKAIVFIKNFMLLGLLNLTQFAIASHDNDSYLYESRIEFNGKIGNKRHIGRIGLLLPLLQNNNALLFATVYGMGDTKRSAEGNFGIGYRQINKNETILGGYGYYDLRKTPNNNFVHQLTLGVELIGKHFETRANVYLPNEKRHIIAQKKFRIAQYNPILHKTVFVQGNQYITEASMRGFDFELGGSIPKFPSFSAFGTFYVFKHENSIIGGRIRGNFQVTDWLSIEGESNYDKVRGMVNYIGFRLSWNGLQSKDANSLIYKMTQLPVRDIDVVVDIVRKDLIHRQLAYTGFVPFVRKLGQEIQGNAVTENLANILHPVDNIALLNEDDSVALAVADASHTRIEKELLKTLGFSEIRIHHISPTAVNLSELHKEIVIEKINASNGVFTPKDAIRNQLLHVNDAIRVGFITLNEALGEDLINVDQAIRANFIDVDTAINQNLITLHDAIRNGHMRVENAIQQNRITAEDAVRARLLSAHVAIRENYITLDFALQNGFMVISEAIRNQHLTVEQAILQNKIAPEAAVLEGLLSAHEAIRRNHITLDFALQNGFMAISEAIRNQHLTVDQAILQNRISTENAIRQQLIHPVHAIKSNFIKASEALQLGLVTIDALMYDPRYVNIGVSDNELAAITHHDGGLGTDQIYGALKRIFRDFNDVYVVGEFVDAQANNNHAEANIVAELTRELFPIGRVPVMADPNIRYVVFSYPKRFGAEPHSTAVVVDKQLGILYFMDSLSHRLSDYQKRPLQAFFAEGNQFRYVDFNPIHQYLNWDCSIHTIANIVGVISGSIKENTQVTQRNTADLLKKYYLQSKIFHTHGVN